MLGVSFAPFISLKIDTVSTVLSCLRRTQIAQCWAMLRPAYNNAITFLPCAAVVWADNRPVRHLLGTSASILGTVHILSGCVSW